MLVFLVIVGGTTLLAAAFSWVWPQTRRDRVVRDFAAKRSLVLDPEAAALAGRLLVARRKGGYAGGVLTIAIVLPALWLAPEAGPDGLDPVVPVVLFVVVAQQIVAQIGATLGAVVAMRRATPRLASGLRFAHTRAPSVDDFLPPLIRWWSPALLALAAVAGGVYVMVRPDDTFLSPRWLLAAWSGTALAVLVIEVAARLLAGAPQPAASPAALAFHDEIKSDLLSGVAIGSLGSGFICVAVASDLLPEAGAPVAAALFVPLLLMERQRSRRVRQRLWDPAS